MRPHPVHAALLALPLTFACSKEKAPAPPPSDPSAAAGEGSAVDVTPKTPPAADSLKASAQGAPFAEAPAQDERPKVSKEQLAAFAAASNRFAVDLFHKARTFDGNLAFSPASIELALGMTLGGARGDTAKEMQSVLHVEGNADAFHQAASGVLARWNDPQRETYQLSVVNRLFGEQSYTFSAPFIEMTGARYRAPLQPMSFRQAAEAERRRINGWVAEQTRDLIKDLLPEGSVNADTRMVLVNAIYFLGTWVHSFDESATRPDYFYLADGSKDTVPLMSQEVRAPHAEVGDVQLLQLPYRGDDLAMVLALPKTRDGLGALEAALDRATLDKWFAALAPTQVKVFVPRFEISGARLPLTDLLPQMGMKLAFEAADADFSGMSDANDLFLSDVFHEAYVRVDEKGTEAAAATAAVMQLRGAAPPRKLTTFRADHPFLFFIRDTRSGTILFMGRVADPGS